MLPLSNNPFSDPPSQVKPTFQFKDFEGIYQIFEVEEIIGNGPLFDLEIYPISKKIVTLDFQPCTSNPKYYIFSATALNKKTGTFHKISEILKKEQKVIFHDFYSSEDLRIEFFNFEYDKIDCYCVDFGTNKSGYEMAKLFVCALYSQTSFEFDIQVGKALSLSPYIPPAQINDYIINRQTLDLIGKIVIFPRKKIRSENQLNLSFKEQILSLNPAFDSNEIFTVYDLSKKTQYYRYEKSQSRHFKIDFEDKMLVWEDLFSQTLISVCFQFIEISWVQFLQFCVLVPEHFKFNEGILEISPLSDELLGNKIIENDDLEDIHDDTDSDNIPGTKDPINYFNLSSKQEIETRSEAWQTTNRVNHEFKVRRQEYSHVEVNRSGQQQRLQTMFNQQSELETKSQSIFSFANLQKVTNRVLVADDNSQVSSNNEKPSLISSSNSQNRKLLELDCLPNEEYRLATENKSEFQDFDERNNDLAATFTQDQNPEYQNESQMGYLTQVTGPNFNPFADDFNDEIEDQQDNRRGLHNPADKFVFSESDKCYVFKEAKVSVYEVHQGENEYFFVNFIRLLIDTEKYNIDHNWRFKHVLLFEADDIIVFTIDSTTVNNQLFKCRLSTGALIKCLQFESEVLSIDINGKASLVQRHGLLVLTSTGLNYVNYKELQVAFRRAIDADFGFKSVKASATQRCILGSSQGQIIFLNSPSDIESNYMLLPDESEVQVLDINNFEASALILQSNSIYMLLNLQGMEVFTQKSEDGLSTENVITLSINEYASEESKTGAVFEPAKFSQSQRVLVWNNTVVQVFPPFDELSENKLGCQTIEGNDPIFTANWDQNERDVIILATAFGVYKVNLQSN